MLTGLEMDFDRVLWLSTEHARIWLETGCVDPPRPKWRPFGFADQRIEWAPLGDPRNAHDAGTVGRGLTPDQPDNRARNRPVRWVTHTKDDGGPLDVPMGNRHAARAEDQ
jgi:hypothetical protein